MTVKAVRKHPILLSFLVAVFMAVGVLLVAAPPAHSQESAQDCYGFDGEEDVFCLEKTVPSPATVGEPVTFTITAFCRRGQSCFTTNYLGLVDELPSGVRFVSAEVVQGIFFTPPPSECVEHEGNVRCSPVIYTNNFPFIAEIVVIPTRCGTFTNTVREVPQFLRPNTVSVDFTVVGCEEPSAPALAPAPAPITQETEQEAESGDIDQSFEVSSTGDNSNQCAGVQGVANTGNPQNVIDLLQYASTSDEFEFEEVGSDITVSPESPTTCEQQVNQAASASG